MCSLAFRLFMSSLFYKKIGLHDILGCLFLGPHVQIYA